MISTDNKFNISDSDFILFFGLVLYKSKNYFLMINIKLNHFERFTMVFIDKNREIKTKRIQF